MRKMLFLLLATPLVACGPVDPSNPDGDGGDTTFEATLSLSLSAGTPASDILVDGDVVCSACTQFDYQVFVAGVYEAESQGNSLLSVPATAEVDADGQTIDVTIMSGIPLTGNYITTDANCQSSRTLLTVINNGKIEMRGFANINAEIVGNSYHGSNDDGYTINGTIADNGASFQHHAILVGGNEVNCEYTRE